jgi:hypothetical protein
MDGTTLLPDLYSETEGVSNNADQLAWLFWGAYTRLLRPTMAPHYCPSDWPHQTRRMHHPANIWSDCISFTMHRSNQQSIIQMRRQSNNHLRCLRFTWRQFSEWTLRHVHIISHKHNTSNMNPRAENLVLKTCGTGYSHWGSNLQNKQQSLHRTSWRYNHQKDPEF